MVNTRVDVVEVVSNDGMAFQEVKFDTSRGFERVNMNTQSTEVAYDES